MRRAERGGRNLSLPRHASKTAAVAARAGIAASAATVGAGVDLNRQRVAGAACPLGDAWQSTLRADKLLGKRDELAADFATPTTTLFVGLNHARR